MTGDSALGQVRVGEGRGPGPHSVPPAAVWPAAAAGSSAAVRPPGRKSGPAGAAQASRWGRRGGGLAQCTRKSRGAVDDEKIEKI